MGSEISIYHLFDNMHGIQHFAIDVAEASVRFVRFSFFPSNRFLNNFIRNGCGCQYF